MYRSLAQSSPDRSLSHSEIATAILQVSGMKCAGCVQAVEKKLNQQAGLTSSVVNLVTQNAVVSFQPEVVSPDQFAIALTQAGFPSQVVETAMPALSTASPHFGWRIGGAALLVGLSALSHIPGLAQSWVPGIVDIGFHWGLATLALVLPGRSILTDGGRSLWQRNPNMNTLVGMGAITAYLASCIALAWPMLHWDCFFDAPVMIIGLVVLGQTLEAQARDRATTSLKSLFSLQPKTATRLSPQNPAGMETVPVAQLQKGDWVQVSGGDAFPVDGLVRRGNTLVNEAMLTGESTPVTKSSGDPVFAGTLNVSQSVAIEVTGNGQNTTLARIVAFVAEAQARKAPIQRLADKIAGYFTYGVITLAMLTFLFWSSIGTRLWPEVLQQATGQSLHHLGTGVGSADPGILLSLKLAIAVLVVSCPCALGLATPTAIVVGTSLGAEQGLLIRGGDALEAVHGLDTIIFDKTGTLTTGQPTVTDYWLSAAQSILDSPEMLLQLAASLEADVRHPLAIALQRKATALHLDNLELQSVQLIPGAGVQGIWDSCKIDLGSLSWLSQQGVILSEQDHQRAAALAAQGKSIVFCAIDRVCVGGVAIQDPLRTDALPTIEALRQLNLNVLMLSGDRQDTAIAIGKELGLAPAAIYAEVSATDKAQVIQTLQSQGHKIAMVGDGINDAPALVQAEVGIALSSGTDVAVETAQIVLMRSQSSQRTPHLLDIVKAIQLGRKTFRTIRQNLFWAFAYNFLGIPIAAGILLPMCGIVLSPAAAAVMMTFSSTSVVTNALSLRWRFRHGDAF
jgi:Cu2+-exporting ATPase